MTLQEMITKMKERYEANPELYNKNKVSPEAQAKFMEMIKERIAIAKEASEK